MIRTIKAGLTGTAARVVDDTDMATALGSGTVDVFATPAMIALMEAAAVDALADRIPEGQTSVGIFLEIHHLSATPSGLEVSATATVTEVDGRIVTFEVSATDGVDLIGRGVHRRVVVDSARFLQRVAAKSPR